MIYTGYFAKTKKYVEHGLLPISVAGKTPDFFTYPKWVKLAPRKDIFFQWKNGEISNEEYMNLYEKYLESEISDNALSKIKHFSREKDIILCCYEKSGDFCHRHSLAKFLNKKLNVEIKEFEV